MEVIIRYHHHHPSYVSQKIKELLCQLSIKVSYMSDIFLGLCRFYIALFPGKQLVLPKFAFFSYLRENVIFPVTQER